MRDWLASNGISKGKIAGVAAAVLLVALLTGYMGLCVWVQGAEKLLPGTVLVDSRGETVANLGKLTREQALDVVSGAMRRQMDGHGLTLFYGEDKRVELSGSLIDGSAGAAVDLGFATKNSKPNWKLGLLWLGVMKEPVELSLYSSILTPQGGAKAKELVRSIAEEVYVAPVDFTYELGAEVLVVTPGKDGSGVDPEALLEAVKEALSQGRTELRVEPEPVPGAELTGQALQKLVRVKPQPAGVDRDGRLVPAVVGVSVNANQAQAILDAAAPGEPVTIPLELTPPSPAEDESMFCQELLAQCTLELSGDAPNVSACDGRVLQPGELLSFLETLGEPDGGTDQVASALYDCALYANMSVLERTSGIHAPDFVPEGLDAAVAAPDQDLKLRNSTGFPVRIAVSVEDGKLTVQFYGSDPDGVKVEVQRETKSTTDWATVYEPAPSIPRGTTTESVAPAAGCVVEVYRCVYDASGKLLSRILEDTSTYEARDQVILYNPTDSGPWGAGETARPTATPRPTPWPTPAPTPAPTPTPTPKPTERPPEASMPAWLQTAAPESSAPTPTPTPTPAPPDPLPEASLPGWLS